MKMSIWREMTWNALDSPCTERNENLYCFAKYLLQDMPKEKKSEAFADYVLAKYVNSQHSALFPPAVLDETIHLRKTCQ